MKNKLFVFLLAIVVLSSCSHTQNSLSPDTSLSDSELSHVHSPTHVEAVPATCEENGLTDGMKCEICGVYTDPPKTVIKLGHTCENGICDRCNKLIRNGLLVPESGIWHSGVYKDEFGDPTDSHVVFSDSIEGTFRNSATTGSKLIATLGAEQHVIKINLFEYAKYPVSFSIYSYEVHIKHNETKEIMYVNLEDNALLFEYDNFSTLKNTLCAGEDIQFVIKEDGGSSTYNFTVSASNFYYMYYKTFPYNIDITNPAHEISLVLSKYKEIVNDSPALNSFSASDLLKIYNDALSEFVYADLQNTFDSVPVNEKDVYMKTAKRFDISLEKVKLIYEFVESNYDMVLDVANYEKDTSMK